MLRAAKPVLRISVG